MTAIVEQDEGVLPFQVLWVSEYFFPFSCRLVASFELFYFAIDPAPCTG